MTDPLPVVLKNDTDERIISPGYRAVGACVRIIVRFACFVD